MKPVIGITSYEQEASWGHWTLPAALIPVSYVRSVELAGGRPLVVPPVADAVDETLEALDGLVLSGGADVDPAHFAEGLHPMTTGLHPERDEAELMLLEAALAREMPVLAICRGMQILNVSRGGSLHQHLPERVAHNGHREARGTFSEHGVRMATGSRTAAIIGHEARVLSSHHQALERIGDSLDAAAWAEDGTVEAIEDRRQFAIGVLWHPEEGEDKRLFEALVDHARRFRDERRRGQRLARAY
ncbi:MAG: gamma-glutamyl-gamma-aminobutyrate hydrolase family protein [Thermoleophilia bacterium]|nr:gamma-glutamyl-gamma-aminobutyrate hydrolase family protein [Thermoleophilia bacterium]MDH5281639.1 gamma-glutamyl-gamma-aminobutyrate hydrolase family protein [Thermoleophilia bacterium]